MNPTRVRELFLASLEQPTEARNDFLEASCGADPEVFEEVTRLLEMHAQLLSLPQETDSGSELPIGSIVGSYRIVKVLGVGGMGRVYLAERADGTFERAVAIKMIEPSAFKADSVTRFEDECRILASLHDPTIATLFDAGRTEDGALYIVMEYVDGLPITLHCEHHRLSLRARVALFIRVCHGVALAHRNLIVHRDLKPGNVLVQADGTPKLLDFGIAKTLTKSGLEAGPSTHPMFRRATPAYASPEQLSGAPANTGMDVFALGVMLYELLTGHLPEQADTLRPTTATDDLPIKPSLAAARARVTGSGEYLDADLDVIILKALSSTPNRYPSVEMLANDLQAYLDNRPVSARSRTYTYRARKFAARNRALSAMAAFAMVALLIAGAALLWTSRQATREREALRERAEASQALSASLFDLDRTLRDVAGATLPRQTLAASLSRYLDRLDQIGSGDPRLERDVAASLRRLAEILGNPNGPNLGDRPRALKAYLRATAILEGLQHADPTSDATYELALTRAGTGDILAAQNDRHAARLAYDDALEATRSARDRSADARFQALEAGLHRSIGDLLLADNQVQDALSAYQRALSLEQALVGGSNDSERQRFIAVTHLRIGTTQARRGAWDESRAELTAALDGVRALGAANAPRTVMRDTAVVALQLAQSIQAVDPARANTALLEAIDILRTLARDDPADARVQHDLLAALVQYGDTQRPLNADGARLAYREAQGIARALNVTHDAQSEHDLEIVTERLVAAPPQPALQLELYAIADGKRTPFKVDERLPAAITQLAVSADTPRGWSRYVIAFGSNGKASILDDRDLERLQSVLPIAGPPPAETILLLAVPAPLGEEERTRLAADIGAVPGPRALDYDGQVVWNSDTEDRIVSQTTARGTADTEWMKEIRTKLLAFKGGRFCGRTFPISR